MLDKPQIVPTNAQLAAVIRLIIPREEIRNVMGPGIAELRATLATQGIGQTEARLVRSRAVVETARRRFVRPCDHSK
jgi:hypothetical protein